jgi:hypothetical protein
MEPEMIFRTVAIVIAAGLLISNFNYVPNMSWLTNLFKKTSVVNPKSSVDFLDVVGSWHTLKSQCKELELTEASEKLDEVFPLLNEEE